MNRTQIYFDNAATTPLNSAAKNAMAPFWDEIYGNASSPYATSRAARMALDSARIEVAKLIGAHADEIAWTGGGTEADNWALLGVAFANLEKKGHFIISSIEHHAVLEVAGTLRELGFEVDFAPATKNGEIDPDGIKKLLRSDTLLVSLMSANNETGAIQPVAEIAKICRENGVLFHCDATQSAGKTEVDVDFASEFGADLLTLSAHKIGGPKGVGALYIRRGTKMKPLLRGGAQERGRRAGTENVPGIAGFGAAATHARTHLEANRAHLESLKTQLENGLLEMGNIEIISRDATRAPHISSFIFCGIRAESLALNLDLQGFAVGTGSACASGALEPSHVLAAMGYDAKSAKSALRVSFGAQNTGEEVGEFLEVLEKLKSR
ncbi:cysteine desulfurase [Abditibacterium utsteinense]|uniref:cysteine desulfurase n=1 Tax=Abditibacterium utsteinense TaxID=1960156 RepID=A0A2S8SQW2_9BACT|nr:cysteine desulfurase family protein [Abditibacterium utsteinense]PQV63187.1 cysteine desulfurase [Abditibacterium utsteinense]